MITVKKKLQKIIVFALTLMLLVGNCNIGTLQVNAAETYNATKAADYALKHWNNYNNAYCNFNEVYVNGERQGDCTNFVSQCLYAGGLPMKYGTAYGTDGWYYRTSTDRSATWTGAKFLRNYLVNNLGYKEIKNPQASDVAVGDVIFYIWQGQEDFGHSAICTEVIDGQPWVCAHNYDSHTRFWQMNAASVTVVKMNGKVGNDEQPGAFSILSPTTGSAINSDFTVRWSPSDRASHYTISIINVETEEYITELEPVYGTSYTVRYSWLKPGSKYRIGLVSYSDSGVRRYGGDVEVSVAEKPAEFSYVTGMRSTFTITEGEKLTLNGTIYGGEGEELTKVAADVTDWNTATEKVSKTPNVNSYRLSNITIDTSSLKAGTYTVRVWGKTASYGATNYAALRTLVVEEKKAEPSYVKNLSSEFTITEGEKLTLDGTIYGGGGEKLTKVTADVTDWTTATDKVSKSPNTTSYSLSNFIIDTSSLKPGTYTIRVWGKTASYDATDYAALVTLVVEAKTAEASYVKNLSSEFTITEGEKLTLNGTIYGGGGEKLTKVTADVTDWSTATDKVSKSPNANSYSLSNITIDTSSLKAGTYTVRVWGKTASYDATEMAGTATLIVKPNLSITTQPVSASVNEGTNAVFKVVAKGNDLSYQWQFKSAEATAWSDSTMTGANTNSITVKATSARNGYQYRCVVKDGSGNKVTSNVAKLTVAKALGISTQPVSASVNEGENVVYKVVATGANLSYQWQFKSAGSAYWTDSTMEGAKTNSITVKATSARNGYQYRCVVKDGSGNKVTSNAATLTVTKAISISTQPKNADVNEGTNVVYRVVATGTNLSYQWQFKSAGSAYWADSTMDGANTNSITVKATSARSGYQYRCVVKDGSGNKVTSNAATLTVKTAISISTQPTNANVNEGMNVVYRVVASGSNLSYQWQFKKAGTTYWTDSTMTGSKTNSITVQATTARNGYQYRCVVKDGNGNKVTSNAATLTVVQNPGVKITGQPASQTVTAGNSATFKVTASGSGLTYQWQFRNATSDYWSNSSMAGSNTNSITVKATTARNGYQYRCVVKDSNGNKVTSNAAKLTVQ